MEIDKSNEIKEAMANIAHTTLQNVKDFAEGRPLVNEVVAS